MSETPFCLDSSSQGFEQIALVVKHEQYYMKPEQLIFFLQDSTQFSSIVDQFSLDIGYCNIINLKVMGTLASILSNFRELTHLSLKFEPETLSFNLQKSNSEETLLVKNQFAELPLLKALSISINRSKTDDAQISYICQLFSSQTQLQYFKIELEGTQITKTGFTSIRQLINSFEQLTQLTISISNNVEAILQNEYLCLWDSLYKLKKLEDLAVSIIGCDLLKSQGDQAMENYCSSQMESLKILSFKLLESKKNNYPHLIKEFLDFLRYLPKLESLSIECGDDYNLGSEFLISIFEVQSKLNTIKLNTGRNIIFKDESQVQQFLKNLAIEPKSNLLINHDYNFMQIQIISKDDLITLDLKFETLDKQKEELILRVVFIVISRFIRSIKIKFRQLKGLEDILQRCDFDDVEELQLDTFFNMNNLTIISLFLDTIPNSKLQLLNLQIDNLFLENLHYPMKKIIVSDFKDQILQNCSLKKINFKLDIPGLKFSLQEFVALSEMVLNNEECELNIIDFNIQSDEEANKILSSYMLVKRILSQKGNLQIDLDYIKSKVILTNNRNITLNLEMCNNVIKQFCKDMLQNLDGFQLLENCSITQRTNRFVSVISNPIKLEQLQQNISPSQIEQTDFSQTEMITFMRFFSVYSYNGQIFNYHYQNYLFFSQLKKISMSQLISNQEFQFVINQMKSVEQLDIRVFELNNQMINCLSRLKHLKHVTLRLSIVRLNQRKLIHNENIISFKLKFDDQNKINKKEQIFKMEVKMIIQRIYNHLVCM